MPKILRRVKLNPGELKPSDYWRTPAALYLSLDDEFGFSFDLAADRSNHWSDLWLGPGGYKEDALQEEWHKLGGRVNYRSPCGFLNPPYSSALIGAFMSKAAAEAPRFTTVALVPYTPDTKWWRWTAFAAEIREIPHRVGYLKADGQTKAHAMFPSAVVVFRPQPGVIRGEPRRVVWDYLKVPGAPPLG